MSTAGRDLMCPSYSVMVLRGEKETDVSDKRELVITIRTQYCVAITGSICDIQNGEDNWRTIN